MPEIDMEKPGTLLASSLHGLDYTFLIVADKPDYTPAKFEADPNSVTGADLFYKSPVIPDKDGNAKVELGMQCEDIRKKMQDSTVQAKIVLVGTMKNYPHARRAVIEPYTLKKKPKVGIQLKALIGNITPANWVTYHHPHWFVEMVVNGPITQIQIAYTLQAGMPPMHAMWEQTAPGQLQAGRVVFGGMEPHAPNAQCKLPNVPHSGGWWGSCGFIWGTPFTLSLLPGVTRYIIGSYARGSGNEVLTVSGTGSFATIKEQVTLIQSGAHPHPGD